MKKVISTLGVLGLTVALAACGDSGGGGSAGAGSEDSYSIVFLAASSQNGYNQAVYEGIQEGAAELSEELGITIETKIQDGQFDATTQLSQLQNAGTQDQADAIVVVPHDGPALTAAFPLDNEAPVVAVLNPIGTDITDMSPQVDGVVSTVATPPGVGARLQAESLVEYCEGIDPCKVALLAGLLNSPLDIERLDTWEEVLGEHANIQIVSTLEGAYDRDQSLTAVSNMLQANADVDAILSNADQQTMGAQIALENAGIDPSSIFLTGGGGTIEAVQAVRDGLWTNAYLNFPKSMGKEAVIQAVNALTGQPVTAEVDGDSLGGLGPIAVKEDLDNAPDYTGEWSG